MQRYTQHIRLLAGAVLLMTCAACSPSLSPLYRDYKVQHTDETVQGRIQAALVEAGWSVVSSSTPNTVQTQARTMSHWGLYKVTVSIEAASVGNDYVRVFVHPYREYITGGRSKIPYLPRRLRDVVLSDLNEAFESEGLALVGTPVERDRTLFR